MIPKASPAAAGQWHICWLSTWDCFHPSIRHKWLAARTLLHRGHLSSHDGPHSSTRHIFLLWSESGPGSALCRSEASTWAGPARAPSVLRWPCSQLQSIPLTSLPKPGTRPSWPLGQTLTRWFLPWARGLVLSGCCNSTEFTPDELQVTQQPSTGAKCQAVNHPDVQGQDGGRRQTSLCHLMTQKGHDSHTCNTFRGSEGCIF